jgi:opacity protein-like surface antigen
MKKNLILTLLVVFGLATISSAQFAVRAGLNLSNITFSGDDAEFEFSDKVGFHVGLMADFGINDNLSFRPGVLFSQRGAKLDFLGLEVNTNLTYIDIPLSFTYAFSSRESGFFIEAGPNVQLLMSAKIEADGESEDVKDDFESLDFGLLIGAGYRVNSNLSFGVNYNLGLANIAKGAEDGETAKNRNIGIYAAYAF